MLEPFQVAFLLFAFFAVLPVFPPISSACICALISLELSAICLEQPFGRCHCPFPPWNAIRRPTTTPQTQFATAMAAQKRITKVCQPHISLTEPILTLFQELGELTASPPSGVTVGLTDEANLFEWNVTMDGPGGSPYAVSLPSLFLRHATNIFPGRCLQSQTRIAPRLSIQATNRTLHDQDVPPKHLE